MFDCCGSDKSGGKTADIWQVTQRSRLHHHLKGKVSACLSTIVPSLTAVGYVKDLAVLTSSLPER